MGRKEEEVRSKGEGEKRGGKRNTQEGVWKQKERDSREERKWKTLEGVGEKQTTIFTKRKRKNGGSSQEGETRGEKKREKGGGKEGAGGRIEKDGSHPPKRHGIYDENCSADWPIDGAI